MTALPARLSFPEYDRGMGSTFGVKAYWCAGRLRYGNGRTPNIAAEDSGFNAGYDDLIATSGGTFSTSTYAAQNLRCGWGINNTDTGSYGTAANSNVNPGIYGVSGVLPWTMFWLGVLREERNMTLWTWGGERTRGRISLAYNGATSVDQWNQVLYSDDTNTFTYTSTINNLLAVVQTYDGANLQVYINGERAYSAAKTMDIGSNTTTAFGPQGDCEHYLVGFANRAWTQQDASSFAADPFMFEQPFWWSLAAAAGGGGGGAGRLVNKGLLRGGGLMGGRLVREAA